LLSPQTSSPAGVSSAEKFISLEAGQTVRLSVKPREYQSVRIVPPAGRYAELRLELPHSGVRGSFVKIQPEPIAGPDAADPVISDSGLDFVRLPLPPASSSGAAPVVLHVTVLTNSRADTDPVETTLSLTVCDRSPQRLEYAKAWQPSIAQSVCAAPTPAATKPCPPTKTRCAPRARPPTPCSNSRFCSPPAAC